MIRNYEDAKQYKRYIVLEIDEGGSSLCQVIINTHELSDTEKTISNIEKWMNNSWNKEFWPTTKSEVHFSIIREGEWDSSGDPHYIESIVWEPNIDIIYIGNGFIIARY